jgi:hypothetical protein
MCFLLGVIQSESNALHEFSQGCAALHLLRDAQVRTGEKWVAAQVFSFGLPVPIREAA